MDFEIAGDEVVVVHRRTLSLSGYLMLDVKLLKLCGVDGTRNPFRSVKPDRSLDQVWLCGPRVDILLENFTPVVSQT